MNSKVTDNTNITKLISGGGVRGIEKRWNRVE
jgi:hypothetical protein